MRYIELQRALQSRLSELERLCERERSILMGRWKTHSLPARKRTPNSVITSNPNQPSPSSSFNSSTIQCCRPATSTEHLLLYNVVYSNPLMLRPIQIKLALQLNTIIRAFSVCRRTTVLGSSQRRLLSSDRTSSFSKRSSSFSVEDVQRIRGDHFVAAQLSSSERDEQHAGQDEIAQILSATAATVEYQR